LKFFSQVCYSIVLFFVCIVDLYAEKVEIVSDNMYAQDMKKEVEFIGNVKIRQLENSIFADKVRVYFNDRNETDKYEAQGSVEFEFKDKKNHYKGMAEKVIYLPAKSKYKLIGKAEIEDIANSRHIKANKIVLDMMQGDAKVYGSKKKPVKFIFEMEQNK